MLKNGSEMKGAVFFWVFGRVLEFLAGIGFILGLMFIFSPVFGYTIFSLPVWLSVVIGFVWSVICLLVMDWFGMFSRYRHRLWWKN